MQANDNIKVERITTFTEIDRYIHATRVYLYRVHSVMHI